MKKNLKRNVTLPKQYWNKLESLAGDIDAGVSDALFMVVDLGFEAMGNEEVMDLLSDEEDEEEDEEEE